MDIVLTIMENNVPIETQIVLDMHLNGILLKIHLDIFNCIWNSVYWICEMSQTLPILYWLIVSNIAKLNTFQMNKSYSMRNRILLAQFNSLQFYKKYFSLWACGHSLSPSRLRFHFLFFIALIKLSQTECLNDWHQ